MHFRAQSSADPSSQAKRVGSLTQAATSMVWRGAGADATVFSIRGCVNVWPAASFRSFPWEPFLSEWSQGNVVGGGRGLFFQTAGGARMSWWSWLTGAAESRPDIPTEVPLPILLHTHAPDAVPPGPLEEGMLAVEEDGVIVHAVSGVLQPDGTIGDLPEDQLEWARRVSYRHLKREGLLSDYGIPFIPVYEKDP